MKRLFLGAFALILSIAANATTFTPIQLLNPAGSTSGQVIVSSGPSTVPAWGGIGLNGIAAIAANTVLANTTSSSATPAAFAMPSCSTSSSILQYTSNSGFTCSTAIWASPPAIGATTPSTGKFTTIQATGAITPSSTAGIVGTTVADNAAAGSIGEYLSATGTGVSISAGTSTNMTSIALTAGDWEVSGSCSFVPAGSTTVSSIACGASSTSATLPANPLFGLLQSNSFATGGIETIAIPMQRFNVSTGTTVFLVAQAGFATSTMTVTATIRARRVR